jgi:FkbM family methyltransferase|tara:strand:+ start:1797 stop:2531 length:735 start_codon:yes stop_codon:yes gene_type:complete
MEYNTLKDTVDGTILYNPNDTYVGKSIESYGRYQLEELKVFDKFVQSGDTVIDVGANIGTHTLWFANKVGASGFVMAFEPQRLIFQTLCANMAINSVQNVDCRQLGVGYAKRLVKVPVLDPLKKNNFGGLSIDGHAEGEDVAICRVDDIGLTRCDFMKIDVEGMEPEVLQGAMNTIVECRPILYLELDRDENVEFLQIFLEELKYKAEMHAPPLYSEDYEGENIFGEATSKNVLAIPQKIGKTN